MLPVKETIRRPYVNHTRGQRPQPRLAPQVKPGTELRALLQLQRQPAQQVNIGVGLLA